jgi:hypothetical protein
MVGLDHDLASGYATKLTNGESPCDGEDLHELPTLLRTRLGYRMTKKEHGWSLPVAMADGGTRHCGTAADRPPRRETNLAEAGKSMAELTMTHSA